jgi:serine/threonine protein kinase
VYHIFSINNIAALLKRFKTEEMTNACVINHHPFNECYRYHTNSEGMDIILGEGSYGKVFAGVKLSKQNDVAAENDPSKKDYEYAVKKITKEKIKPFKDYFDGKDNLNEVVILQQLRDHPHIIDLHDFFDEGDFYYLVMENMTGGELFDRIVAKKCYSESEARDACKMILHALSYMHKKGIVHRDLKPENLLLVDKGNASVIKIADFGALLRLIDVLLGI